MNRWFGPILLALGILWTTCAWAQNDTGTPDTTTPTQPGPKPAFTYPDAAPSLDFLNGAVENSSLTLGIGTGFSYLSSGYGSNSNNQGRWQFQITPSIRIQQFRPRLRWNLGYTGGYQTYTQPGVNSTSNYNLFSQDASAGFLWQMSPHWQLMGNDSFIYSANPFDSYLTRAGVPTLNDPNPLFYTPLTTFKTNNALLTLTDQLTKVDTLAFSGTENLRRTSTYNLVTSVPFYNLTSYGGRASYAHKMSPRLTLGAGYDFNSLDFVQIGQRSGIQTIQFTVDYLIRPNVSISGWIGPQYTSTKTSGVPMLVNGQVVLGTVYDSLWSTAAGVTFAWQGIRNSLNAGFTRGVSDGGGIIATSQSNSVDGSYRRQLTAKMDLVLSSRYSHLSSTSIAGRTYDRVSFNSWLSYKLTKSLVAKGQYAYLHYNQSSLFLFGFGNVNENIVGATITYTWTHPLGR